jgi:hypothetical protein
MACGAILARDTPSAPACCHQRQLADRDGSPIDLRCRSRCTSFFTSRPSNRPACLLWKYECGDHPGPSNRQRGQLPEPRTAIKQTADATRRGEGRDSRLLATRLGRTHATAEDADDAVPLAEPIQGFSGLMVRQTIRFPPAHCFRRGLGSYGSKVRLRFGAILDKVKSRIQEYPNRARSDTANGRPARVLFPCKPDRDTLP